MLPRRNHGVSTSPFQEKYAAAQKQLIELTGQKTAAERRIVELTIERDKARVFSVLT